MHNETPASSGLESRWIWSCYPAENELLHSHLSSDLHVIRDRVDEQLGTHSGR